MTAPNDNTLRRGRQREGVAMATIYLHLSPYSRKVPADLIGMSQEQLSGLLTHSPDEKLHGDYLGVPYICVATAERSEICLLPQADMVTKTVATMRARQKTLRAEAEVECTRIDTVISKLLAIEHSPIPAGEERDCRFSDFEDAKVDA